MLGRHAGCPRQKTATKLEGPEPWQLLINVDESAGTGKSYVIKLIPAHVEAAARVHGGRARL